jgi:hypothetical protein
MSGKQDLDVPPPYDEPQDGSLDAKGSGSLDAKGSGSLDAKGSGSLDAKGSGSQPPLSQQPLPQPHPPQERKDQKQPLTVQQKIDNLMHDLDIHSDYEPVLHKLDGVEIVILADESGSMTLPIQVDGQDAKYTRWDELRKIIHQVSIIASVFDDNGIDVHFLNRQPDLYNLLPHQLDRLHAALHVPPAKNTPSGRRLAEILQAKRKQTPAPKKIVVLLITDGDPSDPVLFERTVRRRDADIYLNILACTSDEDAMVYLNQLDRSKDPQLQRIDVTDDFLTERKQVMAYYQATGQQKKFSYGDYLVKAVVGSLSPALDQLDEAAAVHRVSSCCCLM